MTARATRAWQAKLPLRLALVGSPPNRRALRLVTVVALDRARVADCLDVGTEPLGLWPSSLYGWLAESAARSPVVWDRCRAAVDDALAPWVAPFRQASVAEITQALTARDGAMGGEEIAAALWSLVRRRDPALDSLVERLAEEAEILVTRAHLHRA